MTHCHIFYSFLLPMQTASFSAHNNFIVFPCFQGSERTFTALNDDQRKKTEKCGTKHLQTLVTSLQRDGGNDSVRLLLAFLTLV